MQKTKTHQIKNPFANQKLEEIDVTKKIFKDEKREISKINKKSESGAATIKEMIKDINKGIIQGILAKESSPLKHNICYEKVKYGLKRRSNWLKCNLADEFKLLKK